MTNTACSSLILMVLSLAASAEQVNKSVVAQSVSPVMLRYTDERWGYAVSYPSKVLKLDESLKGSSADGSSVTLVSSDRQFKMILIGGIFDSSFDSPLPKALDDSIERERIVYVRPEDGENNLHKPFNVVYKTVGKSWFAYSGVSRNTIIYVKTMSHNDVMYTLRLEYPYTQKVALDATVRQIVASFSATGNTAYWWRLVDGLENSVRWKKGVGARVSAPIKFLSLPNPLELVVTEGGTVQLRYQSATVDISSPQKTAYSDGPAPFVECGTFDFDGKGDPKVIVAWGDGLVNLNVKLFEYVGGKSGSASSARNWQIVGNIDGQSNVSIESRIREKSKTIAAPFGSQGLETLYGWRAGRLVEIEEQ